MDYLVLIVGIALAFAGGELFVRGSIGVAAALRVPSGVIGATVAAFATSSPELAVAVTSALDGNSAVAVGDALGSNVVNVALVLGVAILLAPLAVDRGDLRRNLPFAIAAPLLTAVLLLDGRVSRTDAVLLLAVFVVWLVWTTVEARRSRVAEVLGETRRLRAVAGVAVGLALLVAAGQCIVWAAKGIGASLGLDEFVVGATLVALGTSTPELATTVISRLRGHDEIGTGTVIGSNIFNNLWIVGVACLISPVELDLDEVALAIGAGVLATLLLVTRDGWLRRGRGAVLLTLYSSFTVVLVTSG